MMKLNKQQKMYGEAIVSLIFTGSMVCCAKAKDIPSIFNTMEADVNVQKRQ